MRSLRYITSRRANKALENQDASMAKKLKPNLGNHGTNKKSQITAMDLVNKVTGDDHVLNERSRTTEDEIKGNTLIYMNKTQPEYYEYF